MRAKKRVKENRPKLRTLKIQEKIRVNRYSTSIAPEIRLCGTWLEKAGFQFGQRVLITPTKGLLIIQVQSE